MAQGRMRSAAGSPRRRLCFAALAGLGVGPSVWAGIQFSPIADEAPVPARHAPSTQPAAEAKVAASRVAEASPAPIQPMQLPAVWTPVTFSGPAIRLQAPVVTPRVDAERSATRLTAEKTGVTIDFSGGLPLVTLTANDAPAFTGVTLSQVTEQPIALSTAPARDAERFFSEQPSDVRPESLVSRLNGSNPVAGFLFDNVPEITGLTEDWHRPSGKTSGRIEDSEESEAAAEEAAAELAAMLQPWAGMALAVTGRGGSVGSSVVAASVSLDVGSPRTMDEFGASFTGAGGGGGGATASSRAGFVSPPSVQRTAAVTAMPALANVARQAFAAGVRSAPAAASQATGTPVATSTADTVVIAPIFTATVGQANLPPGVLRYIVADVNPTAAGWATSRGDSISFGKSAGYVANSTATTVHAALWNNMTSTVTDLHPTSGAYKSSQLFGTFGSAQQVGFATTANGGVDHAMFWTGSPTNPVDLNPGGYDSSYATSMTGTTQVGYAFPTGAAAPHAMLWKGSATNYVDLNPAGFIYSYALAAAGTSQVGYGLTATYALHALVWAGTASATDIHPSGGRFLDSRAVAVSGVQVGGYGTDAVSGYNHAILWTTLSTAIDINPSGFKDSQITAMSAAGEVGYGRLSSDTLGQTHALLWTGSASTWTDLNLYLPSNYDSAEADGIDANGNIVGMAHDTTTGLNHAVVWVAQTPEPAGLLPVVGGVGMLLGRRRRRGK